MEEFRQILGLFLNQTCFSIEQYGSNMVWTNVFQWNMISKLAWNFLNGFATWKIKTKTFLIDLKLGKTNLKLKKLEFKLEPKNYNMQIL